MGQWDNRAMGADGLVAQAGAGSVGKEKGPRRALRTTVVVAFTYKFIVIVRAGTPSGLSLR